MLLFFCLYENVEYHIKHLHTDKKAAFFTPCQHSTASGIMTQNQGLNYTVPFRNKFYILQFLFVKFETFKLVHLFLANNKNIM